MAADVVCDRRSMKVWSSLIAVILFFTFVTSRTAVGEPVETLINQYRSWVGRSLNRSAGGRRNEEHQTTNFHFFVFSHRECVSLFSPRIRGFAELIVFSAIDHHEIKETGANIRNPIIWAQDLSRDRWIEKCREMRDARAAFLSCELRKDTKFAVGFWTALHFREGTRRRKTDLARRFFVADKWAVRLRHKKIPECEV